MRTRASAASVRHHCCLLLQKEEEEEEAYPTTPATLPHHHHHLVATCSTSCSPSTCWNPFGFSQWWCNHALEAIILQLPFSVQVTLCTLGDVTLSSQMVRALLINWWWNHHQVHTVSQFEIGLFCLFNTILVQEILIRIKVTTRCKDEELASDQFEFQGKRILQ